MLILLTQLKVHRQGRTLLSRSRARIVQRRGRFEVDVLRGKRYTRRRYRLDTKTIDEARSIARLYEGLNTVVVDVASLGISVAVDMTALYGQRWL